MSKYSYLDPRAQLEQTITVDLKRALEKRGFTVQHNGTSQSSAVGGLPDIEVWDNQYHITVEVTQTIKSGSDREFLSIKDHLDKTKEKNPRKKCFLIYISPETHYRMLNAIREHNTTRKEEPDLKILPLSFHTFEFLIEKLIRTTKEEYSKEDIVGLFGDYLKFLDDERIAILVQRKFFAADLQLKKELEKREEEKHQKTVENLIQDLLKLEQDLRNYRIATSTDAIKNVIKLVFIKLYEEKQENEGKENRFTVQSFLRFQQYHREEQSKKVIHKLFENIQNDRELKECKLFSESDRLSETMGDDFAIDFFIKPFSKYYFYSSKIDGLGAAYEVLGKLSGKDVKVGQFFTPENVVKFMAKLAELSYDDVVLDPACGTGRFLIHAMYDMKTKVDGRNKDEKIENITKKQLYGTDDDSNVSKLAKMNMYIHGDGKTNIQDKDGLLLTSFDNKIDVILTNPPLGNISYMLKTYDDDFRVKRMSVIPKKNLTEEKIAKYEKQVSGLKIKAEHAPSKKNESKLHELEEKLALEKRNQRTEKIEYKTTGNQMKGGALFLDAASHYLKNDRDDSALPEWKGGKLLIILDDAILNTDDYREVRNFIKKNFYIKAIVSLTPDTFVPVSNTTTKTSILYAIKKEDTDAVQQEPVFFAHADKVGIDTRKRVCENHLFNGGSDILSKYMEFKDKILKSYDGKHFSIENFKKHNFKSGKI